MSEIQRVPLEFLQIFLDDPARASLELLSIPQGSTNPFFRSGPKVSMAFDKGKGRENPFDELTYQFDPSFKAKSDVPRFMHIDLAINRDKVGMAMCHATGFVTRYVRATGDPEPKQVRVPIIEVDFMGRLAPRPEFGERDMSFPAIEAIVEELAFSREFNLEHGLVTFDRFQSHQIIESIHSLGIPCGLLSIDHTTSKVIVDYSKDNFIRKESVQRQPSAAMGSLRDAIYGETISFPLIEMADDYRNWLEKEIDECQWDADKQKAIKMDGGSDDLLQAVAGAVYNCTNNAEHYEVPDDINNSSQSSEAKYYDRIGRGSDTSGDENYDGFTEDRFSAYGDRQSPDYLGMNNSPDREVW
jgi:hypothetical protein